MKQSQNVLRDFPDEINYPVGTAASNFYYCRKESLSEIRARSLWVDFSNSELGKGIILADVISLKNEKSNLNHKKFEMEMLSVI